MVSIAGKKKNKGSNTLDSECRIDALAINTHIFCLSQRDTFMIYTEACGLLHFKATSVRRMWLIMNLPVLTQVSGVSINGKDKMS